MGIRSVMGTKPNVMDNGRVGAILDRLQERLQQDPDHKIGFCYEVESDE